MDYTTHSILSLISHLHAVSADFTNRRLADTDTAGFVSSHGHILYLLSVHEKLSMKEISGSINRDKSTTTVLVRKLREAGLVQEQADADDGRRKYMVLTERGRACTERMSAISRELLTECYRGFSEKEKQTLLGLLQRMSRNIEGAL
ncbi:MAG TPA: transcriptional regulator [Treponema sp.]|nr:transcriptional regulator [Treponema sp.]